MSRKGGRIRKTKGKDPNFTSGAEFTSVDEETDQDRYKTVQAGPLTMKKKGKIGWYHFIKIFINCIIPFIQFIFYSYIDRFQERRKGDTCGFKETSFKSAANAKSYSSAEEEKYVKAVQSRHLQWRRI